MYKKLERWYDKGATRTNYW